MDTRNAQNKPQRVGQSQQYLVAYNLICTILWIAVLGRLVLLIPMVGLENVYGGVGDFTKWTQTLAVMEIIHSASGTAQFSPPYQSLC